MYWVYAKARFQAQFGVRAVINGRYFMHWDEHRVNIARSL